MTAIEPRPPAPVTPWEMLARQADVLASSAIIPRQYQGRPEDIIAAGLMGHELGWGVMTSLQLIHVVEGKPEVSAEGMVALIRRAGHSVTGTVSPEAAAVQGRRGDNGDEMAYTFTQEDAKRADLAGKTNWRRYPSSMLWARAVSQLARMLFPDVLLGVSYVHGEISGADFELGEPMIPPPVDGVIDVTGSATSMVGPVVYVTDAEVAALLDLVRGLSDDDKAALKAEAQTRNRPGRYSWSFAPDHHWTPHELTEAKGWIYSRAGMEPWDDPTAGVDVETGEVVDAVLVDDEGLAPDGLPADPEFDVDNVTVAALTTAAVGSGRIDGKSGVGTQRKRLVALAAELVGVTVEHADELVADQAVAEELLAKLSTPPAASE